MKLIFCMLINIKLSDKLIQVEFRQAESCWAWPGMHILHKKTSLQNLCDILKF